MAAILTFFAFIRIFDVPSGFGWRYPYILNFFSTLVVFVLTLVVAIGAFKLGTVSQDETTFFHIKTIEIEKELERKQKEIDLLRRKIDDLENAQGS